MYKTINQDIKNILFDLGNVIIDTDINLTIQEFKKFGIENITKVLGTDLNKDFYYNFEKGFLSDISFRKKINDEFNLQLTAQQFDYAWNKMLLTIKPNKIEILKKIKSKYKIFLLSNTNKIHIDYIEKQDYWFNYLYDYKFYSHQIGCRKPDNDAFIKVISLSGIKPEETLFIDDRIENIEAAKKLKFKTILFQNITFEEIFC